MFFRLKSCFTRRPPFAREQTVIVYILGVMEGLVHDGYATGGEYHLSTAARAHYQRLQEDGFIVSAKEVKYALMAINKGVYPDLELWAIVCEHC